MTDKIQLEIDGVKYSSSLHPRLRKAIEDLGCERRNQSYPILAQLIIAEWCGMEIEPEPLGIYKLIAESNGHEVTEEEERMILDGPSKASWFVPPKNYGCLVYHECAEPFCYKQVGCPHNGGKPYCKDCEKEENENE